MQNFSLRVEFYFWTWEEEERRNFVPPSHHVMFCLLHKHQWNTKPFHFDIVWLQKVQFIAVIFSPVKKSCYFLHVKIIQSWFHVKGNLVFHCCLYYKICKSPFLVLSDLRSLYNARYFLYSQICHKKGRLLTETKKPSKFSLVEAFQLGELSGFQ